MAHTRAPWRTFQLTSTETTAMDMRKSTFSEFKDEVERLLIERGLDAAWARELIDVIEGPYVQRVFDENGIPEEVATEIYITKADLDTIDGKADIVHVQEDGTKIEFKISGQVEGYFQQLIELGLWGSSPQEVAATLINRQLADLLATGIVARPTE